MLIPEVKCLKSLIKIHTVVTEVSGHKAKGECESTSYYTGYDTFVVSGNYQCNYFHTDTLQAVTKLPFVYQVIFTPYIFWPIIRGTFFVVSYSFGDYL